MRRFIVLCVFALVVTVNGDCKSDCSEICKSAIVPNSGDNCTMYLNFGPDVAGLFQSDLWAESCDMTCELICNHAGMPENTTLPQSRQAITAALIGGGAAIGAAVIGGAALAAFGPVAATLISSASGN